MSIDHVAAAHALVTQLKELVGANQFAKAQDLLAPIKVREKKAPPLNLSPGPLRIPIVPFSIQLILVLESFVFSERLKNQYTTLSADCSRPIHCPARRCGKIAAKSARSCVLHCVLTNDSLLSVRVLDCVSTFLSRSFFFSKCPIDHAAFVRFCCCCFWSAQARRSSCLRCCRSSSSKPTRSSATWRNSSHIISTRGSVTRAHINALEMSEPAM